MRAALGWGRWKLVDDPSTIESGGGGKITLYGPVAQRSEQRTHNPSVDGSIPSRPLVGRLRRAQVTALRSRSRTQGRTGPSSGWWWAACCPSVAPQASCCPTRCPTRTLRCVVGAPPRAFPFTRKEKRGRDIGCAAGADRVVLLVRPDAAVAGVARQCVRTLARVRRPAHPPRGTASRRDQSVELEGDREGVAPLEQAVLLNAPATLVALPLSSIWVRVAEALARNGKAPGLSCRAKFRTVQQRRPTCCGPSSIAAPRRSVSPC